MKVENLKVNDYFIYKNAIWKKSDREVLLDIKTGFQQTIANSKYECCNPLDSGIALHQVEDIPISETVRMKPKGMNPYICRTIKEVLNWKPVNR